MSEDRMSGGVWDHEEMKVLLAAWSDVDIQKQLRNIRVYEKIVLSEHGFHRTPMQCREKIKQNIKDSNNQSGNRRKTFQFFEQMDSVLGCHPVNYLQVFCTTAPRRLSVWKKNKIPSAEQQDLSYKDHHWHEQCFKCAQCSKTLVEKFFAAKDELLLCTDCYSQEYSSKCFTCKKTIMPGSRKMEYRGNSWHETCFLCHRCQQPIGTKSFIPKDNGYFCVPCFEKQFAYQCNSCKKTITTGGVTYHDKPWHRECFLCTGCKKQLAGQRFTSRDEFSYCLDCFSSLYAKKCVGCTKPITSLAGVKYISFEERQWHTECFTCMKCSVSLVGRGFLTHRDDTLCTDCGREK